MSVEHNGDLQMIVRMLNEEQVAAGLRKIARCVYCGRRGVRQGAIHACARHRYLVALDPYYN